MKLLCLVLFVGSVLSSVINIIDSANNFVFTDFVSEVELTIKLVNHLITMKGNSEELTKSLKNLEKALNDFADVLYTPEVMIHYCGTSTSKDPVQAKLLNKYQRDTINPFAETVNFKSLNSSKFSIRFNRDSINIDVLKRRPDLLGEFDRLIEGNVKLFSQPKPMTPDGKDNRYQIKVMIRKFMVRTVRKYVLYNGIDAPLLSRNTVDRFELAVSVFVNNGVIAK